MYKVHSALVWPPLSLSHTDAHTRATWLACLPLSTQSHASALTIYNIYVYIYTLSLRCSEFSPLPIYSLGGADVSALQSIATFSSPCLCNVLVWTRRHGGREEKERRFQLSIRCSHSATSLGLLDRVLSLLLRFVLRPTGRQRLCKCAPPVAFLYTSNWFSNVLFCWLFESR